jgi:hypothetical protein
MLQSGPVDGILSPWIEIVNEQRVVLELKPKFLEVVSVKQEKQKQDGQTSRIKTEKSANKKAYPFFALLLET